MEQSEFVTLLKETLPGTSDSTAGVGELGFQIPMRKGDLELNWHTFSLKCWSLSLWIRRHLRKAIRQCQSLGETPRPFSQQVSQGIPVPWPSLGVEVVAIPVPETHTRTLCVCTEMPTTPHTPGISELWGFPPGVDKRFSRAEDTKTDPDTMEGMANTGTVDAKITWSVFVRAFLVSVVCSLIALLLLKVAPAWAKDIKE